MKTMKRICAMVTGLALLFGGGLAESGGFHRPSGDVKMGLAAQLTWAFMSVAASGAEDAYGLWVSDNLDVRITDASGEYLSSKPGERRSGCSFGYLSNLGDALDQKLMVFIGGDKTICMQGTEQGMASYELLRLQGLSSGDETVCARTFETSEFSYEQITLTQGVPMVEQLQYNPLEIGSRNPFTGKVTTGSEHGAEGTADKGTRMLAAPDKAAYTLTTLKSKTSVGVLASCGDYDYTVWLDADMKLNRGWAPRKNVSRAGVVPELVPLSGTFQTGTGTNLYLAPDDRAAMLDSLPAGERVELIYAERDGKDQEWALIQTAAGKKKQTVWAYVPASCLTGWQEQVPPGFRMGSQMPVYQWTYILGKDGYTEFMSAQADRNDYGVVLSGRTSARKGDYASKKGNLDALILRLDPQGNAVDGKTYGGSDVDGFHWVVPAEDGYYVAGYTRSTDKDFRNIWDPSSHLNAGKGKLKSSLAVMGKVRTDLEADWAVSFGTGEASHSFGFDMIIPLADGNWAGTGWMYDSKNSGVRGHGKQDFYVVKMSPEGRIIQAVSLGDSAQNVPDSAVPTPDGGLIMVGCTHAGNATNGLIMIIDSNLNTVSTITYGGSGEDVFDNIRALPDGTYMVTGFTNSVSGDGVGASHGGYDFWVMNIDSQGRAIWNRRFGGSGDEELCGTTILADGSCLMMGSTESTDGDVHRGAGSGKGTDAWAVCVSNSGRLLWQYAYGTEGTDAFNAAGLDPADGGVVLAGTQQRKSDKNARGVAVKVQPPFIRPDDPDEYVGSVSVFDPMDVALVIDVSGSMADYNRQTGKTLLSYAQDAAISFARTIFALSPESRVGIVAYDDVARKVASLSGAEARQSLYSKIRAMQWGGTTNTGGGFEEADRMLTTEGISGRNQLTMMLTDGLANEGNGDPIQYAIDAGSRLAEHSLVYTVGMLGEQAQGYLNEVRRTLHAGYETRYFEVTFREMEE